MRAPVNNNIAEECNPDGSDIVAAYLQPEIGGRVGAPCAPSGLKAAQQEAVDVGSHVQRRVDGAHDRILRLDRDPRLRLKRHLFSDRRHLQVRWEWFRKRPTRFRKGKSLTQPLLTHERC